MFVLRQVFHCKPPHCTQSLKLPGSTWQPLPAACLHLLLDTFQRTPITQNAPHPANLELIHYRLLLLNVGVTPFNGQSKTKQSFTGFTQLKGAQAAPSRHYSHENMRRLIPGRLISFFHRLLKRNAQGFYTFL